MHGGNLIYSANDPSHLYLLDFGKSYLMKFPKISSGKYQKQFELFFKKSIKDVAKGLVLPEGQALRTPFWFFAPQTSDINMFRVESNKQKYGIQITPELLQSKAVKGEIYSMVCTPSCF